MQNKFLKFIKASPILLVISLFIGVALIAAGGGALYPPIYGAAAPFVCSGNFVIESESYSYKPGQRGVEHKIFCESFDGQTREDISILSVFVAGFVYSAFVFGLLSLYVLFFKPERIRGKRGFRKVSVKEIPNAPSPTNAERLEELQKLKDSGLITDEEFQRKREEIINDI